MVNVTRGTSGELWRMEYMGQVDYLDEEPTPGERAKFAASVRAQRAREKFEAEHPLPVGHSSQVERIS